MGESEYDVRNCQSLLGYAAEVHRRSGAVCQLCGCGAGPEVQFDLWRQLTVEHLIGGSQGGYPGEIRRALEQRFPDRPAEELEALVRKIHDANTITACHFCNSSTSREQAPYKMGDLIRRSPREPDDILQAVGRALEEVLEYKRAKVRWKVAALRNAFASQVEPDLRVARMKQS